jgi:membrane protease YdiL (CAAX protease family)
MSRASDHGDGEIGHGDGDGDGEIGHGDGEISHGDGAIGHGDGAIGHGDGDGAIGHGDAGGTGDRDPSDADHAAPISRDGDRRDSSRFEGDPRLSSVPSALPPKAALPIALLVTIVAALVLRFAFAAEQAGSWTMLVAMGGAYVPFAALAIHVIRKEGALATELRPKQGDLSFGAVVAALMYGAAMAGRQLVLGAESPRSWWVARVYLQLGDTSNNRMIYVGLAVLVIAAIEELVWRGLVMRSLLRPLGPLRAWLLSSALYGLAHVGTVSLLAHPVAGPNPLVVVAAFGGGLVWGHLYNRTGRLGPSLFAHALFTWAIVDFPLWRPM